MSTDLAKAFRQFRAHIIKLKVRELLDEHERCNALERAFATTQQLEEMQFYSDCKAAVNYELLFHHSDN